MPTPSDRVAPRISPASLSALPLALLSLGFTHAWPAISTHVQTETPAAAALVTGNTASHVASVITMVIFALTSSRIAPLYAKRYCVAGFLLLGVVGNAAKFLALLGVAGGVPGVVSGSVMTGVSSAALLLMCGEIYASVGLRTSRLWASASYVLAAALYSVVAVLDTAPAALAAASMPLVAGAFLLLKMPASPRANKPPVKETFVAPSFPWELLVGICLYSLVFGLSEGLSRAGDSGSPASRLLAGAVILLVLIGTIRRSRDPEITFAYRAILPLTVSGFLTLVVFGTAHVALAHVLFIAGYECFGLFVWIFMCDLTVRLQLPPIPVFAWGYVILVGSLTLAGTIGARALEALSHIQNGIALLCAIIVLLLVMISEMLFGEGTVLVAWGRVKKVTRKTIEATMRQNLGAALSKEYSLSPRELDVLLLLMQGLSAPALRQTLHIADGTLKVHMHNLYAKTGVHSRQELLRLVDRYSQDSNLP